MSDLKKAWDEVVRCAKEDGYVDVSRGFGSPEESEQIAAIIAKDEECKWLLETFEWALGILESLPWDEMTTATEGGQEFIDEFRRKAGKKGGGPT